MESLARAGLPVRSTARRRLLRSVILLIFSLVAGSLVPGWNRLTATAEPRQMQSQPEGTVDAQMVQYMSSDATISALLAEPKGVGRHPAVIIVHDAGGVNNSVNDVARRFAEAGFVALAPNLLSRTPDVKTPEQAFSAIGQLPMFQPISDLKAGLAFLQKNASVDPGKISVVGFGWGGWRAFKLAEDAPTLYRAVIFYGSTPTDDDNLGKIHVPVLAHYAQLDFRVTGNALWSEKELGSKFKFYVYPGAERGFLVSSGSGTVSVLPANADAAKLAWTRTLEFLKP
jgi:carboxymethylenebutenolidase